MPLTRPSVKPVWASTAGDNVTPTDIELAAGWPVTNIPPARQRFNWFFNRADNAVRYFSRRGLSDHSIDETYEVGDRCIGDDGKTYKAIPNASPNLNKPPSTNPLFWERWGFTLSELWAYLTSDLNGGVCPNTGPASAPTPSNPFTQYTSALGEKWEWVAGLWVVTAKYYGLTAVPSNASHAAASFIDVYTFTAPRTGRVQLSGYHNLTATAGNQTSGMLILKNASVIAGGTTMAYVSGQANRVSASITVDLAVGDVVVWQSYTGFGPVVAASIVSIQYQN